MADRFEGRVGEDDLECLRLVISELVTNAVRYAPPTGVTVRLSATSRRLRVEVHDSGDGALVVRDPERGDAEGRGLRVVEDLATDWGVVHGPPTIVWAEIATAR
jgi:anti-sigma regulatory factor (Ser/Thr protein kinase)